MPIQPTFKTCKWQDYYRAYKRIAEIKAQKEAEDSNFPCGLVF